MIPNVFEKLKRSKHLPQLPQVMLKLVKACNSDGVSVEELTRIIATDPSLTAKLLQIIGSPYVNLPKEVSSVKTAVVYLGVDTIRNMAISACALHFFNPDKKNGGFDMGRFWYHSYTCGIIAEKLARQKQQDNPDEYFLAGLLHDIGRLALMQTFPRAYAPILKQTVEDRILAAEMQAFQADTPQVSAWLFRQWHLNPLMSNALVFMNEPGEKMKGEMDHICILHAANRLSDPNGPDQTGILADVLDIPDTVLDTVASEAREDVLTMAEHLGIHIGRQPNRQAEQGIALKIRDVSFVYGTLETLLEAKDETAVMQGLERGVRILFNVPRVFFFFPDEQDRLLAGSCTRGDKAGRILKSIALPMANTASLIVRTVKENQCQSSFTPSGAPSISDTQIIRLLEAEGFFTVPVRSGDRAMGAMVLGGDEACVRELTANREMVGLLAGQAGVCLENFRFHKQYADNVNEKKMEAFCLVTDKVVHEINNPLSIIGNYLESLSLKLPDRHPAQEELSVVKEEMRRISLLLDGLSGFSNPKISGFEPVDMNRLCRRMLEILKKSILLPRGLEARLLADPDLPEIMTDPNGMKQVLINLVKNSAEAMETGGKIHIQTRFLAESAKILVGEKKRLPGVIEIRVTDNGPGIEPLILEKLFEPYNSSKAGRKNRNAGLGLAVVHSIVKELNGRITCQSREGKGTRFSVRLPVDGKAGG